MGGLTIGKLRCLTVHAFATELPRREAAVRQRLLLSLLRAIAAELLACRHVRLLALKTAGLLMSLLAFEAARLLTGLLALEATSLLTSLLTFEPTRLLANLLPFEASRLLTSLLLLDALRRGKAAAVATAAAAICLRLESAAAVPMAAATATATAREDRRSATAATAAVAVATATATACTAAAVRHRHRAGYRRLHRRPAALLPAGSQAQKRRRPRRETAWSLENLLPNGSNGPFAAPFHRLNGWNPRFSALG